MGKREKTIYISFLVLILIFLAFYFSNLPLTGHVTNLGQFTNEADCVGAGYTWVNETDEVCTNETVYANEIGWINFSGYTLTGPENALNFNVTEAWNITDQSAPTLIPTTDCFVDSTTGVVTNATTSIYPNVNFSYTYNNETCIDVVTGGNCTGDCGPNHLNLCNVSNCETDGHGYWYDANNDGNLTCNSVECSNNAHCNEGEVCHNSACCVPDCSGKECGGDGCGGSCGDCSSEYICNEGICETEETDETAEEESTIEVPVESSAEETPETTGLNANDISVLSLNPESSQEITWVVRNTGTLPLSSCKLKPSGDFASWVSFADESVNLGAGEEKELIFSVAVPQETTEGSYLLDVSLECSETAVSKGFSVNVVKEKLGFDVNAERRGNRVRVDYSLEELSGENQNVELYFSILDVAGQEISNASANKSINANSTREFRISLPVNKSLEGNLTLSAAFNSEIYSSSVQEPVILGATVGGFAVFEGIGTGSIIILVIVVLVLVTIVVVVRRIRKKDKNIK